ncbi:MAG: conserved membrane protein of unknown function [Promethearchaeota archaeon]|nr:MAG: conserved membrane protein of unknown function [Candidatus Lokiarchaeota archaeon]
MDFVRFIQVYIAQGFIGVFFLFLVYKILKRGSHRLNKVFSAFYVTSSTGIFLNFIYAPLTFEGLELLVLILNFLTNYLVAFSIIFLVVFQLIILKSEKVIDKDKQKYIIIGYGVILAVLIIFLFFPEMGVKLDSSTDWKPVWFAPFYFYMISALTICTFLPVVVIGLQIYRSFQDKRLKEKWRYYMLGTIFLFAFLYGIFTANFLNIPIFRTIWALASLFLTIVGGYLLYYGVGRQIE